MVGDGGAGGDASALCNILPGVKEPIRINKMVMLLLLLLLL